ncbi:hypothetical protein AFM11_23280 [Mycolicibacterium wolinskyi]|uniref:Uncharacterized protein n=1 Tax=Mycolicibacterium wolinskyi TaxID=59750 RepID=A0A132PHG7_9MYCO|nr:hypothetical protein AFM11_23280 [Mycolicibacterium wolinskyi]
MAVRLSLDVDHLWIDGVQPSPEHVTDDIDIGAFNCELEDLRPTNFAQMISNKTPVVIEIGLLVLLAIRHIALSFQCD